MEACCSFKAIVGGVCGFDLRDRKQSTQIIPLISCIKDISKHKTTYNFSGIESEIELILFRAGIFTDCEARTSMTICPRHRSTLGLGWSRGASTRCRVPESISKHGQGKGAWSKGERGIGKQESEVIFRQTGLLVPVGSGVCRKCRGILKPMIESREHDIPESSKVDFLAEQMHHLELEDDEIAFNFQRGGTPGLDSSQSFMTDLDDSQASYCEPTEISLNLSGEEVRSKRDSREKLNLFLASRDISPIRNSLTIPWDKAAERTKRYYTRKAKQVVHATLEEIAPESSEMLLTTLKTECKDDGSCVDSMLLEALVECYNNASTWSTRRQMLSIMADKVSFKVLQSWIPDLSRYRYNIARHHLLLHGRGSAIPVAKSTRMFVSREKLDHFLTFITSTHVMQDLPFGEKLLKLSSNTEIRVPNVVRSAIPEHIVKQYQSYCHETDFEPMSRSTLCRILKVCSASVRKSLHGLDYFSADGAKAFDDIQDIVEKLGDTYGKGLSWEKEKTHKLKLAKRYLKCDYRVHVSSNSRVPDHCRAYALSFEGDKDYTSACDHQHDLGCDRCNLFPDVIEEIESVLESTLMSDEEKDEMRYIISQSKKNIQAWKAHTLRSINQDEARLDTLKDLDPNSVLVTLDWAMKFLPRKYRESQSDWFGKRGISWHIAVATRKLQGQVQTLTFVHVFQTCTQDSPVVLAVLEDVVQQLKTTYPDINNVFLRQDNAGCYHSAATLLAIQQISTSHKVKMRIDFSDPQGGKGACDRKAATIKNSIRTYVNSGHDVQTANQMKVAIESSNLPGLRVMLCGLPSVPTSLPGTWEGVSFINNIEYNKTTLKVWREYGIGEGKSIKLSHFGLPTKYSLPKLKVIEDAAPPKANFVDITARKKTTSDLQSAERQQMEGKAPEASDSEDDTSGDGTESSHVKLFSCLEDGCIKTFQRFSSLQRHLDFGKHQYVLEHETLLDKAMLSYATKLEHGMSDALPCQRDQPKESEIAPYSLPMGWALKSSGAKRKRFSDEQKRYLTNIFLNGEKSGIKADANSVSSAMRKARNEDGSMLFKTSEFLTPRQISSFFSRLAKKKVLSTDEVQHDVKGKATDDDDNASDIEEVEKELEDLAEDVMGELAIRHPIMFDAYNICEMAANCKLQKFSIAMLQDICKLYELDISAIKSRRKQPYIDILNSLVDECCCQRKA